MAAHARLDVLATILEQRLVVAIQPQDPETTGTIARSLLEGGAKVLELLHRGDGALDVFREIVPALRRDDPELIAGVGTIVEPLTAALYLAHGADFVVGPTLDAEVARLCNRRKVAYLPGCGTVSEISAAEELGCEIVKLFPASAMNGPEFLRSLRGPMPWSRVMPTGNGVPFREEAVRDWLEAGACALGIGPTLIEPGLIAARDFKTIARRTEQLRSWIVKR